MSYKQSLNFLLLSNDEQLEILSYLKSSIKYRKLFDKFNYLYQEKLRIIREDRKIKIPKKEIPKTDTIIDNEKQLELIKYNEEKLKEEYENYKKKFLKTDKLEKLIRNKNVALIGPANYLINFNQGKYIDKFDVIIRFNNNFMIDYHLMGKIGSRTDILVYNFKDPSVISNLLEEDYSGIKLVFCPYPEEKETLQEEILKALNTNKIDLKIEFMEKSFYENMMLALDGLPNSFILMILTILRQNVKNLYVSGFSFLHDGYYDKELNKKSNQIVIQEKDRGNQMKLMKKIFNANDKLFLDNGLINLLYKGLMFIFNNILTTNNFYSTLNYQLTLPYFMKKYLNPKLSTKNLVLFGNEEISNPNKFHLVFHSNKLGSYKNEVFIHHQPIENLTIQNKGNIYFSNTDWNSLKEKIPTKNWNYIISHHFYVNGNYFKNMIEKIKEDIEITNNENILNNLYVLFTLIIYGKKTIFVSRQNMVDNGLLEIYNVLNKINLIKSIN